MAKNRKLTRLITCVLLLAIMISAVFTVYLSATSGKDLGSSALISKYDGKLVTGIEKHYDSSVIYQLPGTIDENEEISLIIEMPTNTLLDAYNASSTDERFSEFVKSDAALALEKDISDEAAALRHRLSEAGINYKNGKSYSTVLSGFEILITASDFADVCKALGDSANVIVGEVYEVEKTELVTNTVNVQGTGIFNSAGFGYDGTGMVVAVLDTGLDYYHSAFADKNFKADRNKLGLTFDEVTSILASKNTAAERLQSGLTASDVYISEKVPFAFDYADYDSDVFPLLSNHGTHVAGVIAGNDDRVAEVVDGEELKVIGAAPNAQLAIMKIFSDVQSTARTSWILSALEDCVNLEVDVINMSIGTACGFSRETDKESVGGVYDRIRDAGISMVVAASNSFNSAYSSDKNGNLPLTSNPDSSTVGSPSTYKGTISVASIEGAKTPYLTFNGEIIYFIESTDRFSEEKDFVDELLSAGATAANMEYVTIPGAGRTADYTGIDVTGKIVLVKRGHTTFEEKANVAEKMGAAAIIIYNNVSGDIKMNVGETTIAVASISQNDGELLAAQGSGTITISKYQTSGPFMSDFSSWGPTPDLEIKPEITAHGGSILSAVPGQSYDRISGTSMASPNVAGLTALLRQYVVENFPDVAGDPKAVAALVNQLMMSTADIITNKNGLPYSIRKQGAGLANLTNSASTTAYIITYDREDGSAMDKSKIELGDDPAKKGVYELKFSIKNFGTTALTYNLSTFVLTEGVNETKTSHGETTVTESAYELSGATTRFTVDGGTKSGNKITVAAGTTATVSLTLTLSASDKKYLDDSFENGMYVEGFVVLDAAGSTVDLSVPYLAFYGDWTKAPLFDLDYFETNKDELDDSIDLLDKNLPDAYATRPIGGTTDDYVSYLGSYYFMQNPQDKIISADRKYISLSNQTDAVNSLRYVWAGLLRNAAKVEIEIVEDSTGEVVYTTTDYDVRKSYGDGGPIYPANIDIEFSAIEHNLKNNTAYTVNLKGFLDYGDGGEKNNASNEFSFPLFTDFQAPAITGCEFYTEYDKAEKKDRLYAKMAVYDNHYAMSLQVGYVGESVTSDGATEYVLHGFDKYLTPVYSEFNTTNYVVYELTDYIDDIKQSAHTNTFTVVCYDYALNTATYEIALPDDYISASFAEEEINLNPNQVFKLSPLVTPDTEWAEFIQYNTRSKDIRIVGNEVIALPSADGKTDRTAEINAYFYNPETDKTVLLDTLKVNILDKGDQGYRTLSKPVVSKFEVYGFYVDKAYYMLANEDRDLGLTGDEAKFASPSALYLSMYPSEAVTLRYKLLEYFPDDTEIKFESANEKVVKVDQNGRITAVDEGFSSVTLKVLMDGKSTYYSKTVDIEVKEPWVTSGPSLSNYYGTGYNGKVEFPKDLAVTEIGQFAFSNFDYVLKDADDEISEEAPDATKIWYIGDNSIKEVVIPEGIERIGPYAFANLTALEKVTLPSTLETIDYGAFFGCVKLEKVVGIENVKFINQEAFYGCSLKGTLDLKNTVAISDYAFAQNTKLEKVILSEATQSVGASAFAYNTAMQTLTVNADIIKLGKYAFEYCSSLKSVSFNASVVPEGIFNECTALNSVTLGKDVMVVGEYAFRNTALTSFNVAQGNTSFSTGSNQPYLTDSAKTEILLVAPALSGSFTAPATVTSVANAAFSGNGKLTSVNLPNVTSVGNYAFSECTALTSVTLGELDFIGKYAFENVPITTLPYFDKDTEIGSYAFTGTAVEVVHIPDGMNVPEGMLANCKYAVCRESELCGTNADTSCTCLSLKEVYIGNDVTIGRNAFAASPWNWVRGVEDEIVDPDGLTLYYFMFRSNLDTLVIGDNAVIGDGAFYGAVNLESVTLGEGATIGRQAFYNSESLRDIDLSKVVSIGDEAFSGDIHYIYADQNLVNPYVTVEDGLMYYNYKYNSPVFTNIDLSSLTSLGDSAFAYCKMLAGVTLGEELSAISDHAFEACSALTSVSGIEKVEEIGDYAFAECALASLDLSAATDIGKYSFCYNESLSSLKLAEGASIGEGAFSYSTALAAIDGEEDAVYFGDYAFAYTSVSDVDLSAANYVGKQCFLKEDASPLTVKLGDSIEDIGDNPFANCILTPFTKTVDDKEVTDFDIGEKIKVIDGSVYKVVNKGLVLICWAGGNSAKVVDGTVRIADMAFMSTTIKQVMLPSSLLSIGHKAFFGCDDLVFVAFTSYNAPTLEEEYDYNYYSTLENMPSTGLIYSDPAVPGSEIYGIEIVPYFMWNAMSLPTNVYYGANFVDYIGYVENKITMVRPVNAKNYNSFIFEQYFDTVIDGSTVATPATLAAIEAISNLPELNSITLADKATVEAARAAYNVLSNDLKALVTNYETLTKAEKRISDLEYLQNNNEQPETPPTDDEKPVEKNEQLYRIIGIAVGATVLVLAVLLTVFIILFARARKNGGAATDKAPANKKIKIRL